jgi:hypothetical protein
VRHNDRNFKSTALAPNLAGRFHHLFELALLLADIDAVSDDVGGEAALRADGELIERDELRRLVDAAGDPSSPHKSCPDCIIATCGYDSRDGQGM